MKYLRLLVIFTFAIILVAALGLDFDPPLNEGIEFPETNVEETSIVELTIRNDNNVNGMVMFEAPQNRVFSIEPLQVQIGGGQQAVMEFSFSPEEAGEVSERVQGTMAEGMMIERISIELRGVGIEGDPVITVEPLEIPLEILEPGQQDEATITIGNVGEARLIFEVVIDDDAPWLSVDPLGGVVLVDEETVLTITTTEQIPERGIHETELIIRSNDPENDVVIVNVELNVDFFVEFILGLDEIDEMLETDSSIEIEFEGSNGGDAGFSYHVDRRLTGGADADPWDLRSSAFLEEVLQDDFINGVVFADGRIYVSSGNNGDDISLIYVLDADGEYITEFEQVHESRYGMRDLTWDGEIVWGADAGVLYGYNTDGEHVATIDGEAASYRSLTWNPEDDVFISADITSNFFITDINGNLVETVVRPDELRTYGLAYWSDDPDGYNLYVFSANDEFDIRIIKVNLENSDAIVVAEFNFEGGRPGGIHITNELDYLSWVLIGIVQNPDYLGIWQIDGNREWFRIEPSAGALEVDGSQQFILTLDASGLPEQAFRGELVFVIEGGGGQKILPVTMEVVEGRVPTSRTLDLHIGWNLVSLNIQPFVDSVEVVMAPLVENDLLLLMKNGAGHFYIPAYDYNNISGWSVNEGYQLKMRSDAQLTVGGESVLRDDTILLREGWQIVSYYPRFPIETTIALSGIEDHLIIAKDERGDFYIPDWHFCNMDDMDEGRGYYINVDAEVELVYRSVRQEDEGAFTGDRYSSVYDEPGQLPVHPVTGSNMSLLVLVDPSLHSSGGIDANTPPLRSR
ncbi:PQQ-like beta-propeller repeat protein, partial [bacterium]|nr:PQQ-like beta-propeller repeat protein [bacterium]